MLNDFSCNLTMSIIVWFFILRFGGCCEGPWTLPVKTSVHTEKESRTRKQTVSSG